MKEGRKQEYPGKTPVKISKTNVDNQRSSAAAQYGLAPVASLRADEQVVYKIPPGSFPLQM